LREVEPSGPQGQVTAEDVKAHAGKGGKKTEARETPPETEAQKKKPVEAAEPEMPDFSRWGEIERVALRSVRRSTARRTSLSWSQIPHVTHQDVADVTALESFRQAHKSEIEEENGALTLTVFAIKAAVAALKEMPRFNASLDLKAQEIIIKHYYHIGVAVDTERGLLVPVVRDADRKSILELSQELIRLAELARNGEIEREDMSGGTFTITNVGPLGGTAFTPIINFPQAAILGLARARLQTLVDGSLDEYEIKPRLILPLVLAFDHRLADGADAARFLNRVIENLQNPDELMLKA
jgi:pyruvate dehydrogenase E2 component (dihydrolipoamide acetyltransferase)